MATGDLFGAKQAMTAYQQKKSTPAKTQTAAARLDSITPIDRGGHLVFTNRKKDTP